MLYIAFILGAVVAYTGVGIGIICADRLYKEAGTPSEVIDRMIPNKKGNRKTLDYAEYPDEG